jgi:hypothetical protein
MPPVGNQGAQNSCVGWALGYYYRTFLQARDGGWQPSTTSQQFSPSWIYNQRPVDDCSDDRGVSYYSGFRILQDLGAAPLADMPYRASDSCTLPSDSTATAASAYSILDFANVFSGTGQADLRVLKGCWPAASLSPWPCPSIPAFTASRHPTQSCPPQRW